METAAAATPFAVHHDKFAQLSLFGRGRGSGEDLLASAPGTRVDKTYSHVKKKLVYCLPAVWQGEVEEESDCWESSKQLLVLMSATLHPRCLLNQVMQRLRHPVRRGSPLGNVRREGCVACCQRDDCAAFPDDPVRSASQRGRSCPTPERRVSADNGSAGFPRQFLREWNVESHRRSHWGLAACSRCCSVAHFHPLIVWS